MILANHCWVALAVWKIVSVLLSGFPQSIVVGLSIIISFLSHFAIDRIPHEDWSFVKGDLDKWKLLLLAVVDVGLAVVAWCIVSIAFFHQISLAGFIYAFSACAPDLNKFVKFPSFINYLHELAHHSWRKNGINDDLPTWQLTFVAVVIAVSLIYHVLGF